MTFKYSCQRKACSCKCETRGLGATHAVPSQCRRILEVTKELSFLCVLHCGILSGRFVPTTPPPHHLHPSPSYGSHPCYRTIKVSITAPGSLHLVLGLAQGALKMTPLLMSPELSARIFLRQLKGPQEEGTFPHEELVSACWCLSLDCQHTRVNKIWLPEDN